MTRLRYILAIVAIFCTLSAEGQRSSRRYPGRRQAQTVRLSATSRDPEEDSLVFMRMRKRMEDIRRKEKRPTIALVLSGGGAKGAAHVSIIKYLEEKEIPVDMVLGTSMGGLIGGLFALGYTGDELDTLVRGMDWGKALSDNVDQDVVSYNKKMRQSRYLVSIPFHYAREDFAAKVEEGVLASARRKGLDLSADQKKELVYGAAATTRFNSLPAGYAYGVNVNNIIASMTVGYQDSTDFFDLPIPFFCVASDVVSGKAKYWTSGPLNTAMRSTMSIPVLFEPVRYKDMILIDGGTRNNYPTDMARAMGADIVIGVMLADADPSYAQINNIMDLVMQISEMLGREVYMGNVNHGDVTIHPDMSGYNMLSFETEAVDTILRRGYKAAVEQDAALSEVKKKVGSAAPRLQAPKAVDINKNAVKINEIRFNGVDADDARHLRREVKITDGEEVKADRIEEAVCRLFSMDTYEAVNYTLSPDGDGYILNFNCSKGPVHRIGAAGRADSEEFVAAMLNIGLNVNKLRGFRLDLEGRLGNHLYGLAKYSYTAPRLPTFNLEVKTGFTNAIIRQSYYNYRTGFRSNSFDAYLSGIRKESFDFRVGIKQENYAVSSWLTDSGNTVPKDQLQLLSKHFRSLYANIRHYTLDDLYFPSKGLTVGADFQLLPWNSGTVIMGMDFRNVFRINEWFSILPEVYFRSIINGAEDNLFYANFVGGTMRGRYIGSQMPFVGFNQATPAKDIALVLNLDFRACIANKMYASLLAGLFNDNDALPNTFREILPTYWGVAGELSYDSIIGPVRARLQWSDYRGWSAYIGAGFDF
ncbi:MAG: patatin-like phospholipase family protein [Bacteroidales bacterium]|nr:patatin-like phospholipase family protein [Bacteroidales bacterium]